MHIIKRVAPWAALACGFFIIAAALFVGAGMAHADPDSDTYTDQGGSGLAAIIEGLIAAPFVTAALWVLACGLVASYVASTKGRSFLGFFLLGVFFLGPLAIAVAILATPISPAERMQPRAPRTGIAALFFGK